MDLGLGAGPMDPPGHDRHGDAPLGGPADEPVARHHLKRRAEDEQQRGLVHGVEAGLDHLLGDGLAEEHDIGLEPVTSAEGAPGRDEALHQGRVQIHVPVRAQAR